MKDGRFTGKGWIYRFALILVLAGVLGVVLSRKNEQGALVVDMTDAVQSKAEDKSDADGRPVLSVAIGAMISPATTRRYYQDFVTLLADKIGRKAVFFQRRTYAEINALVENRTVDVAFVCSGPYAIGHAKFGLELLAVPVVRGEKVYYSYILAPADSKFRSLNDLRQKRFAFTDPDSNTGCLVPTYMLAERNEKPESFFANTYFSNSHDNSIMDIADGKADGAAVDSLIWDFVNTINPSMTKRTRIIEKSRPYGIPPVVVHPDMPKELKKQLRKVFLELHQDASAQAILARLQIDRFDEGDDAAYDTVREMQRWVATHKESQK